MNGRMNRAMGILLVLTLALLMEACVVTSLNNLDGDLTLNSEGGATIRDNGVDVITINAGDGHSLDAADGNPADALFVNNDGDVGIGTRAPSEKLSVSGTIESTSGGFKFPDGTIQTTAATGLSGINVHEISNCDGSGAQLDFPVLCPTGKVAVGGGGYISGSGCGSPEAFIGQVFLVKSWPIGNPPYGWRIAAAQAPGAPSGIHFKLVGHVICVDAP
jgi:hypothetical protein